MKLYPAILTNKIKEFKEKINALNNKFPTVHVDIMDNKFVPNKTINLSQLKRIKQELNYSFHLMIYNPERYVKQLKKFKVKEAFIHCEAAKNVKKTIEQFKKNKIKVGIAFNPETKIEARPDYLKLADKFLIMTIRPGFSGQKLLPEQLKKIKLIRKHNKKAEIQVDGGINFKTFNKVKKHNPNIITIASGIFKGDVDKNIKKWNTIIKVSQKNSQNI